MSADLTHTVFDPTTASIVQLAKVAFAYYAIRTKHVTGQPPRSPAFRGVLGRAEDPQNVATAQALEVSW
jgi:hypothetical protein